ncbi:MAG TPA: restriction endonuclease subunit S [Candidatus Paceibacterota bacterium]|nr:restriction endonuclease subunit S [Candidatus Paceibacterota bacterium]HON21998.1 restriction endonuclease subunit S [Candidatus Paceibacterota bacterium]HPP65008.1 restriction endonuclease subunit S [Candidatus Paceibacterota bacterium]HRR45843.1 restriction endonuclease subunit S [Candidatus Paceibacterota bacterium]
MHLAETKFKSLIDRIDANFYVSRLGAIKKLHRQYKNLGDLCKFPRAKTPPRELYFNAGIPVIKLKNVSNYFLQLKDTDFIPQSYYEEFVQPKTGDILITATGEGTIGRVGIFENGIKCVVTAEVMLVRAENINPYFLLAYLRSPDVRYQLERFARGSTGQTHLYSKDVALIPVPQVSGKIQIEVEKLVKQAHQKKKLADEKYEEAEQKLYELLGHKKLDFKFRKSFEVGAGEVFSVMRFDAEYYQPKYKEIIEILNKSDFKVEKLEKIIKISTKKVNPKLNPTEKIKYVELADINPSTGEIDSFSKLYGYEAPSRARMAIKAGNVLIASLAGSLDNIGIVPEELDEGVASTGFFVVSSENYLNEFLFLLFRSEILKKQLEQKTAGAIMAAVPKSVFGDLLMPVIPKSKQEEIAELVKQSFALQKEAKCLLDGATKKVEETIK